MEGNGGEFFLYLMISTRFGVISDQCEAVECRVDPDLPRLGCLPHRNPDDSLLIDVIDLHPSFSLVSESKSCVTL